MSVREQLISLAADNIFYGRLSDSALTKTTDYTHLAPFKADEDVERIRKATREIEVLVEGGAEYLDDLSELDRIHFDDEVAQRLNQKLDERRERKQNPSKFYFWK